MRFKIELYFRTLYYAFFKSGGTPGRLSPKRFVFLILVFLLYPLWNLCIRIAYNLDNLFYPDYQGQEIRQPVFIVGNFRSGSTFLHRLLNKDRDSTSLAGWEIYLAPSIVGRRLLRWGMRLNYAIGNPAKWALNAFEKVAGRFAAIHKFGLTEPEEDGQVLFHIWSTYDLLAFFPFPKLVHRYIYYDDQIPVEEQEREMSYYRQVIKKHVYAHHGKRFVSKNPSYSPKVRALHRKFPDAKFINLVRNPLQVIPSSISLFSNHWQIYGDPESRYPLQETLIEHCKHWYLYPHQYLKNLPADQYICIHYKDLVADPKGVVERIYRRFGFEISPEYERILRTEAHKAKRYVSKHKYSLGEMGLSKVRINKEFAIVNRQLHFDPID